MSITNNLQTKNKFYYVVNPFEHVISNYEDSLKNLTKHYLKNIKIQNKGAIPQGKGSDTTAGTDVPLETVGFLIFMII